ncbi:MAG: signal recognition particle-docking protein FtsY [Phycisphaerae bacterium]|nr:signal recognition particle-docking protein FtsY [Phycisphaerae bacterium]|tara:strand:- start:479 stop:1402 length:924 start_codon:yes stop_codon:yes gene_type:complete
MGLFRATIAALRGGLSKTRSILSAPLANMRGRVIDEETIDELEHLLLSSDVGVTTTDSIVQDLRDEVGSGALKDKDILELLRERLVRRLEDKNRTIAVADQAPTAILVAGVNGVGKTTSVAKIGRALKDEGRTVLLAAADTFRAGAVSQLTTWADRLGIEIVKGAQGADPAAVTFDAATAAISRKADVLLIDTAGRLHTQEPLMRQLEKMQQVTANKIEGAPHEVLLVLDATQGQNTLSQAKKFAESIHVTGIFLSKLDGTARGGIVFAIEDETGIPIKLIGVGERPEDVEPFDPESFVSALIEDGA